MSRSNYTAVDLALLRELYGLTPAESLVYERLERLVDHALKQSDLGYAVNVEPEMAAIARDLVRQST